MNKNAFVSISTANENQLKLFAKEDNVQMYQVFIVEDILCKPKGKTTFNMNFSYKTNELAEAVFYVNSFITCYNIVENSEVRFIFEIENHNDHTLNIPKGTTIGILVITGIGLKVQIQLSMDFNCLTPTPNGEDVSEG